MRDEDSATVTGSIAFGVGEAAGRFLRWVRRGWRDGVYLHARLIELRRPWEHEGPLRWQREIGGLRLVGCRLPRLEEHSRHVGSRRVPPGTS